MIEVINVEKKFGDQKVLKGISTTFEAGQTSLVIGQSGSGKTVFIKSLLVVSMAKCLKMKNENFEVRSEWFSKAVLCLTA